MCVGGGFFGWCAARGKILTIDNLIQRRRIIFDWCCMCKGDAGTVDHLLIHCPVAWELWSLVFSWVGLSGPYRGTSWSF